jgi:dethiobiotin synthetase
VNPFYLEEALAPLVAGRRQGRVVERKTAVEAVGGLAEICELLLVEGAGGLLAPLGNGFSLAELIHVLDAEALIVVRNKLGAISHTLLTLARLRSLEVRQVKVVLMDLRRASLASDTNFEIIRELTAPTEVFRVPYLGPKPLQSSTLKRNEKKLKKTLARILQIDIFSSAFSKKAKRK